MTFGGNEPGHPTHHAAQAACDGVSRSRTAVRLTDLVASVRPKQWIKNAFVAGPLIFSGRFTHPGDIALIAVAILLFSCISGAVYVVNDVQDREEDRHHPEKRNRPIARGAVSVRTALVAAGALAAIGLVGAAALDARLLAVISGYGALTTLYTFALKHVAILDVIVIGIGFVLRVLGGAVVIDVVASPWILLCMGLLALLLGFGKRRHEARSLNEHATKHRSVLSAYSPRVADGAIAIAAMATAAAYVAYTTTGRPAAHHLAATIPFVLVGIARYLWLVFHDGQGDNPTEMAWTDRPLVVTVVLWILAASALIAL